LQENSSKKKDNGKSHFSRHNKRGNGKKGSWFQYGKKTLLSYCDKSGHHIDKCWILYPSLFLKKNRKYVKELARRQVVAPSEVNSLAEIFDK
jgi:hypothetical protein